MAITKAQLVDDILIVLSRFSITDDTRLDRDWISFKADQIRAQLIIARYDDKKSIDQAWLSDLGLVTFYPVNFVDDPSVTYCCSDISKTTLPKPIAIGDEFDTSDIGLYAVMSACGKTKFYKKGIELWKDIPEEHIYSKFSWYFRINTAMYVNKKITQARVLMILETPSDGYFINSAPVTTITAGTVYIVKDKQIYYNSALYAPESTFTGVSGFTSFTGNGTVYLNSQKEALDKTQPYPISSDMARQILIEICTKEFKIEQSQLIDTDNDSKDQQVPQNNSVSK